MTLQPFLHLDEADFGFHHSNKQWPVCNQNRPFFIAQTTCRASVELLPNRLMHCQLAGQNGRLPTLDSACLV